jgi:cation diffusion facilitator family transporter
MSECEDCHPKAKNTAERRILWIALGLNAAMAVIGSVVGWFGESTGVLADALDMLSDASAYAVALFAVGRSAAFKARAATLSGAVLALLGAGVLVEVIRRAFFGAEPLSSVMMGMAALSFVVNLTVLRLLRPLRSGEVHLRASWIFTRADVVANVGVFVSGAVVALSGSRYPDLIVGAAIGGYVIKEALEILGEARGARRAAAEAEV